MNINPIKLSQELIGCKSITPREAGSLDVLEKYLKPLGFVFDRVTFEEDGYEPVENLYAKRVGNSDFNLCFAGHVDVVPPGDLDKWSVDPFAAEIKENILIGRGAVDMKVSIACFISAVSELVQNTLPTISFLITCDEEGDSINGTEKLLKHITDKGEKIDACIVGEPTSEENLVDLIKIGRRGSLTSHLKVTGVQGHVAYPDVAENPNNILVKILNDLLDIKLDDGNEYFPPSNLEITTIDVDNSTSNLIPSEATTTFNIRFNNLYEQRNLKDKIENICRKNIKDKKAEFQIKYDRGSESFLNNLEKAKNLIEVVENSIEKVTGNKPKIGTTGGTSDARFIYKYCPVVECGFCNKTAHKIDEQVKIDDIKTLTSIYKEVIRAII